MRATSGSIVHTIDLPISVVDQLPATAALALDVPPTVVGGNTAGIFHLSSPAPQGGAVVSLTSSNSAVAAVPATITVPAGATSASFTVTTWQVAADTPVRISGSFGGRTASDAMTVQPPSAADAISIGKADYVASKRQLQIEAASTKSTARLTAFVTATDERIGVLANEGGGKYRGQFAWPVNPQNVTVRSDLGGSATRIVALK